ncbi:MAG: hypothetical protein IJ635_02925 [Bacteroidaceae bacterium]|nr:hypothetical protein [Bacteroidaceae bacterium]MBR1520170.1 hypothetical protein [Bacteroidaceae bacterium]
MREKDYLKKDFAGYWYNAKYPPNKEKYGVAYEGYKNNAAQILFYEFAVQNYDVFFKYKGLPHYLLVEPDHVAVCDSHYTEEYEVFDTAVDLIEQYKIDGKPLIELIDELEDVEAV